MKQQKPEAAFQKQVTALAHLHGWLVASFRTVTVRGRAGCYHVTPTQADGKGFPDTVFVRERLLFAELKAQDGRLRPEQKTWIERLRRAGQDVRVWRPSDWPEIERTLQDGA